MNESLQNYKKKIVEYWRGRTKGQRYGIVGGLIGLILIIVITTTMLTSSNMVPLYSDLSLQEAGQIRSELEDRGVQYEISSGGTSILVPKAVKNNLVVDFAAQGIPNTGEITYSFFSDNVSWGMTEEEREIIELDALQTELANLISSIDGIESAKVLINRPEESVFVGEQPKSSSASIVLQTTYNFSQEKVQGLYHLVSKAVKNLPPENIVIMNQNFEYFDLDDTTSIGNGNTYAQQQQIKDDIEIDLQRRVQRILGTMMGQDNVVVSVTTNIDFQRENRVEELIEPVDLESMEGLPVSVERVTETYAGIDGGNIPADVTDIPEYLAENDTDDLSEYEMVRETINNEFNRIRREIVESPYEVRDIGIQVAIDQTVEENGEVLTLSAAEQQTIQEDVESILSSIIETSISTDVDQNNANFNPADKISIAFQSFSDQPNMTSPKPVIPTWIFVVGGIMILAIILLIILMVRGRKTEGEWVETEETHHESLEDLPSEEYQSESFLRRQQLEKMAKEKPDEFAKLLRTWITED